MLNLQLPKKTNNMKQSRLNFTTLTTAVLSFVFVLLVQITFAQEQQPTTEQKEQRKEQKAAKEPTDEQKQQRSEQKSTDAKEPTAEQKQKRAEQSGNANMSNDDMKKTYDEHMKKYNETYEKLDKKAASTNDPEMKRDIAALQSQMNDAKTSMDNFMKNKDSMTPEQQERAKASLREQQEQLKKNYEQLRTKYGTGDSGKSQQKGERAPATPK